MADDGLDATVAATDGAAASRTAARGKAPRTRGLGDAVTQLTLPTASLLLLGADERTQPDADGLNHYGFPTHRDERLVQFSSCTASVPDGVALATAERCRSEALADAHADSAGAAMRLRQGVTAGLVEALRLPGALIGELMLCPSGTDAELVPLAVALHAHGRPVRNILVGGSEAGRGVPVAAAGRWPGSLTALGARVEAGSDIDGLGSDLVQVTDVDVRDARGRARRAFDVEAEVEAHVEAALSTDATVIVHAMEASKTGLRYLGPEWVRKAHGRAPDRLRVVVDAAQGRVGAARVGEFLAAGASVIVTGSKAWSGPPFCSALIPGDAMLRDMRGCDSLPAGLAKVFSETDLPASLRGRAATAAPVNVGLLLRWLIALDEVRRWAAIPQQHRGELRRSLVTGLRAAVSGEPALALLDSPAEDPTIMSFAVRAGGSYADMATLTDVHRRAADAGVFLGQPVHLAPESPPMLRAAIGAATLSRLYDAGDPAELDVRVRATLAQLIGELRTILA
jgi:hypothetical protein